MPLSISNPEKSSRQTLIALVLLSLAVVLTYTPAPHVGHLAAADMDQLHLRRIRFAREHLLGPEHTLPAWNPRELLGAPFWSNLSDFPFSPNRLILLPLDLDTWDIGLLSGQLNAVLAAIFTFLFCRKIGLGNLAAGAAGWTFACNGMVASRLLAGEMVNLESYPALPLLLWLVEILRDARRLRVGCCLACAALLLAGHPQFTTYGIGAAILYACLRGGWRLSRSIILCLMFGAGCAAFSLLPMALLAARSTRVLQLDHSINDLALPLRRFGGFFFPWLDGAPPPLARAAATPFHGYATLGFFWDEFIYCGWLPWIAAALILTLVLLRRADRRWTMIIAFWGGLGVIGLILSSEPAQHLTAALPGTLLRSPARLLYFTIFTLALFLAISLQALLDGRLGRSARLLVGVLLAAHVLDLGSTAREFLVFAPPNPPAGDTVIASIIQQAGDARVGFDLTLPSKFNRAADDVGFYDSIQLKRSYQWLLDRNGDSPKLNTEWMDASQLNSLTLQAAGVKYLLTYRDRPELILKQRWGELRWLEVPNAAPRAAFYSAGQVQTLSGEQIHQRLRNPAADPHGTLMIERAIPSTLPSNELASVQYQRPSPDVIVCRVDAPTAGVLRLIESFDPGWQATIDGMSAEIFPAETALLATAVPAGSHEIRFEFKTPGATFGRWISVADVLALLSWWLFIASRGSGSLSPVPGGEGWGEGPSEASVATS